VKRVSETAEDGAEFGWAFDKENLYLRAAGIEVSISLYLGTPEGRTRATTIDGTVLGYGATIRVDIATGGLTYISLADVVDSCINELDTALGADGIETAIPLSALGALEPDDSILLKAATDGRLLPTRGPIPVQVPDISNVDVALSVIDPTGDDHGPGTYTYPTDAVFTPGSYDLTLFEVGTEGDDFVFTFEVEARIQNPWGSPRGLSIQTFDVYIDTGPGAATGAQELIDGRNASLSPENGWEYGITLEGWDPAIYMAEADGTTTETKPSFGVAVFGDKSRVQMRIDRGLLDGDPASRGVAVAVMSQEGFPSTGVRRIRDVGAGGQWQLGGAPPGDGHTRIIDVIWPNFGESEPLLADGIIPLLVVE